MVIKQDVLSFVNQAVARHDSFGSLLQDLEALLSAARKESAETKAVLEKTSNKLRVLEEDHAKLRKSHEESVKEAVGVRMSMRKMEEQLSSKMAEAAAESNRASEASRMLQTLRTDYNESSLKSAPRVPLDLMVACTPARHVHCAWHQHHT